MTRIGTVVPLRDQFKSGDQPLQVFKLPVQDSDGDDRVVQIRRQGHHEEAVGKIRRCSSEEIDIFWSADCHCSITPIPRFCPKVGIRFPHQDVERRWEAPYLSEQSNRTLHDFQSQITILDSRSRL